MGAKRFLSAGGTSRARHAKVALTITFDCFTRQRPGDVASLAVNHGEPVALRTEASDLLWQIVSHRELLR
jgi:hypothetical protein